MGKKKEMTLPEMAGEIRTAKLQFGVLRWNDDLFTRRMVTKEDLEVYRVLSDGQRFRLCQGARYSAEHNGSWAMPALSVGMPLFFTVGLQSLILSGLPADVSLDNVGSIPIFVIVVVLLFVGLSESRKRACAKTWLEAFGDAEKLLGQKDMEVPVRSFWRTRLWRVASGRGQ